jgi:hypothetical protein
MVASSIDCDLPSPAISLKAQLPTLPASGRVKMNVVVINEKCAFLLE